MDQITGLLNNNQGILESVGLFLTVLGFVVGTKAIKKSKLSLKQKKNIGNSYQAGRDIILPASGSKKRSGKSGKKRNDSLVKRGEFARIEIDGVLWEWYWKKSCDKRDKGDILSLKPFCPRHEYELEYKLGRDDVLAFSWPEALFCRECNSIISGNLDTFEGCASVSEFEDRIKRLIVSRLRKTKLKILKAEYGSGTTFIDITTQLNNFVIDGKIRVTLKNSVAGSDPTPRVTKVGKIRYELDGREYEKKYIEGQIVEIP